MTLSRDERLTVIITTHYIEEARQANICGLMRFGRILVEESPDFLLKVYNFPTLEEVFLKICELDSQGVKVNELISDRKLEEVQRSVSFDNKPDICHDVKQIESEDTIDSRSSSGVGNSEENIKNIKELTNISLTDDNQKPLKNSMKNRSEMEDRSTPLVDSVARTSALFWKNITRLRRNMAVLLFQFLLPSIEVILFCTCIGQHPFDINVAVYNQEPSGRYSNWFLSCIDNKTIIQKPYHSFDSAIQAVKDGEAWAALVIGQNFSDSLQMRLT